MENQNPQTQPIPPQNIPTEQPTQAPLPKTPNINYLKTIGIGMSIVSFCIAIAVIGYVVVLSKNTATKTACTMEAKLCPNGTSVGRTGPKCEFAACPTITPTPTPIVSILSPKEKQQIDAWIIANNLNDYGDPKDIAYPGGTPLFNEATGTIIDKYEYIAEKHLNQPWCTPRPACLDATPRCMIPETTDMCPARSIIPTLTPTVTPTLSYTCPPAGYINCQPTMDANGPISNPSCQTAYVNWVKTNCPGVTFTY
jgi:hypothetical protein